SAWGSSEPEGGAGRPPTQPARERPTDTRVERDGGMRRNGRGGRGRARDGGASPGGGPLLFLDRALAVDAVAREGQRLQPLVGDRLAAPLAVAARAGVDLFARP